MCNSASFVLTKDRILWSKNSDSHEDIITEFGLVEDGVHGTNIVRTEIVPEGFDYTKPIVDWIYKTDQGDDALPHWYDRDDCERRTRVALAEWAESKIILSGNHRTIREHVVLIAGNARVEEIDHDAHVDFIGGEAIVDYIADSAHISRVGGAAHLGTVCGSACIGLLAGDADIRILEETATLQSMEARTKIDIMCGRAHLLRMGGSTHINRVSRYAQIELVYDDAVIYRLEDKSRVLMLTGSAKINQMFNASAVLEVTDRASIGNIWGGFALFRTPFSTNLAGKNTIVVDASGTDTVVHQGDAYMRQICSVGASVNTAKEPLANV